MIPPPEIATSLCFTASILLRIESKMPASALPWRRFRPINDRTEPAALIARL